MSRLFDPSTLMNQVVAANETRRTARPIGETTGQITKVEIKDGLSGPSSKNPGTPWARLDIAIECSDPAYLPEGMEKTTFFYGVMLDMTDGQISTGPNKNIKLGQLRAAAGVNGQPLGALNGQFVRFAIGHKPHPTETDENGAPVVMDEVTSVTKV